MSECQDLAVIKVGVPVNVADEQGRVGEGVSGVSLINPAGSRVLGAHQARATAHEVHRIAFKTLFLNAIRWTS